MRFRNTLTAALLLAGLGAWIYFYEYRGEEGRQKEEAARKKLLDFDPNGTLGLDLIKPGATVSLQKEGADWKMTAPVKARADAEEVSGILSTLSWLETDRKIEASSEDLEAYKLKDPVLKVVVHRAEGKPDLTFTVGDKAPIGSAYYARRGEGGEVVTISSSVDRLLEASAEKLRYKKVVGLDSWKVARFSVARGGSMISFAKSGEEWRIESPLAFPADRAKVSNLLFDATAISADGFEPEGTTPDAAGLAHPDATLQITDKEGKSVTVEFSAKDPNGIARARRADMPEIFKVKSEAIEKLNVNVADYRDIRVAPVERYEISEIRAAMPGGGATVVKDAEAVWHWGSAEGPKLEGKSVDDLLTALDAARATGFIEGADAAKKGIGTSSPSLTLKLKAKGTAAPVEVRIGAEEGGRILVASSASGAIYQVDKTIADNLVRSAGALKPPQPDTASGAAPAQPSGGSGPAPASKPAESAPGEGGSP